MPLPDWAGPFGTTGWLFVYDDGKVLSVERDLLPVPAKGSVAVAIDRPSCVLTTCASFQQETTRTSIACRARFRQTSSSIGSSVQRPMLLRNHGAMVLQAGPETWPVHVVGVPPASRSDPPLLALLGLGAVPRRGYGNMTQIFWDRFCACCLESERLREKPALVKEQIRPIQHAECSQGLALRACGVEWLLLQGFDQHHQCPRSDGLPGRALSRGHRNPTPKSPQPLGTRRRGASKSERERENLLTTTGKKREPP